MTIRASERDVLAYVRRRRKEHDRRRASDRWINIYMGLFIAFYVITGISGLVDTDWVPEPGHFIETIAWLPLILFAVVWAVVRFATWQGPVLFSAPELQWVMTAPLSRRNLVVIRLRRALTVAAVAGAAGGIAVAVAADVLIGEGSAGVFIAAVMGIAALAVMATALSWHVERTVRWSRLMDRVAPLAVALAASLGLAALAGFDTALWWSGPWGWATGPLVAASGWPVPGWLVQAGLLGVAGLGAVVLAARTAGEFDDEELWRRAEARSSAAASLFVGDLRRVRIIARRDRARGRVRGRSFGLIRVPSPLLVIPARDLLTLRRSPGLVVGAVLLMSTAFFAAAAALERPILGLGVFVALYLAGSRLLEPIRLEVDQSDAHLMLPWRWGAVLILHCVVPVVVLTVLGWVGLTVLGVGGFVEAQAIWPLLIATPFVAAALVTPAATSAARRPFPVETLIGGGEGGSLVLVISLLAGPVLAALVLNIAFGTVRGELAEGITGATFTAIGFLAAAAAGFIAWLWTRRPPE